MQLYISSKISYFFVLSNYFFPFSNKSIVVYVASCDARQRGVFNVHYIKSNLYRNGRWRCFEQSLKETDHNCDPCDYRTDNIWKLKRHLTTARHLAAVNRNSGQVNENWSDNETSSGEITTNSAIAGNISFSLPKISNLGIKTKNIFENRIQCCL